MGFLDNKLIRVTVGGFVFLSSMLYFNGRATKWKRDKELAERKRQMGVHGDGNCCDISRFSILAPLYDQRIDFEELKSGIFYQRKALMKLAEGHVLEVGAGTARSLPYYVPTRMSSLLCVDDSKEMLEVGVEKAKRFMAPGQPEPKLLSSEEAIKAVQEQQKQEEQQTRSSSKQAKSVEIPNTLHLNDVKLVRARMNESIQNDPTVPPTLVKPSGSPLAEKESAVVIGPDTYLANYPVRFAQMNAEDLAAIPDDTFDTVVDTFGLCSYSKPDAVLKEMNRVCKPSGRILLYEHGRAPGFGLINWYLDRTEQEHREEWGCTHNKPIKDIVKNSGLAVEKYENFDLGTMHMIVAKPNKSNK